MSEEAKNSKIEPKEEVKPVVTEGAAKAEIEKQLVSTKEEIMKHAKRAQEIVEERKHIEARLNFLVGQYESLAKLIGAKSLTEDGTLQAQPAPQQ